MFFKEQAQIFVQLIISKASSPFFVSWYISKKELIRVLIHVCKIFNWIGIFQMSFSMFLVIIETPSNFQNGTFEIITITIKKIILIQVFFLPLLLNKKNKNEKAEYHATFILFKNQLYSKPGSLIFLLFGSGSFVLYLYVWVKSKFFG